MNTANTPIAPAGGQATSETKVAPHDVPGFDPMKAALEADAQTDLGSEGTKDQGQGTKDQQPNSDAQATGDKKPVQQATDKNAKPGEQGKDGDKPESAYTKAQKEADRRDRSWKALEQEKETFRQEKARYDAEMQGMRRKLQELEARTAGPTRDEHGATADTYDRLAKKYADEGDDEKAALARTRAEKLRRQQPVAPSQAEPATEAWKTPEFQAAWKQNTEELIQAEPELAKADNPVVQAANALLADKQWSAFFRSSPTGIRAAVEVAKLLQKSQQVDDLNKKLTTAQAEVERLNKLTAPRGGNPGGPPAGEKKLADMSDDEAQAHIRAIAIAADSGG